ncbi:MAG: signal peptidase II [Nitrospirae bacterium]|nr:signal peptidase II [Nitrospirota bacterium]
MKRSTIIIFIILLVILLDQASKYLIIRYVDVFDSIEILPFLHIVNVRNTGAAFGILKDMNTHFFITISIIAIIFVIYLLKKNAYNFVGLSLIFGGAAGNLIDRILYGKVVDFMDFSIGTFHWPAFNLADSCLTIGIGIILLTSLFKR